MRKSAFMKMSKPISLNTLWLCPHYEDRIAIKPSAVHPIPHFNHWLVCPKSTDCFSNGCVFIPPEFVLTLCGSTAHLLLQAGLALNFQSCFTAQGPPRTETHLDGHSSAWGRGMCSWPNSRLVSLLLSDMEDWEITKKSCDSSRLETREAAL